jgi:hypothetical protein
MGDASRTFILGMLHKFFVFVATLCIMPLIGGLYGALHDQLSYTISPAYFTHFKYLQFGFDPAWFGGHRPTVAVIGFLATWWVGAFIGIVLGLVCLRFRTPRWMIRMLMRSTGITLGVAALAALAGLFYAWLQDPPLRAFVRGSTDPEAFHAVGTMHLFSYEGGMLGMLVATLWLLRQPRDENGRPRHWKEVLLPGRLRRFS